MRTLSIAVLGNPHPWAPQPVTPVPTLFPSPATVGGDATAAAAAALDGSMGVMGPVCWLLVGALATFAFRRVRKLRP